MLNSNNSSFFFNITDISSQTNSFDSAFACAFDSEACGNSSYLLLFALVPVALLAGSVALGIKFKDKFSTCSNKDGYEEIRSNTLGV